MTKRSPIETDLRRQTFVVTGATSGIGRAAAIALGGLGATVVVVGRDRERGEAVCESIGADRTHLVLADLSIQRDVRRAASEILRRHRRIRGLANVAGVIATGPRQTTEDGVEYTLAVNHMAPFLLTKLLLPALKAGAPSRVVTMASGAHHAGRIEFDDLQMKRKYRAARAYNRSKLANVAFASELARRLRSTGVTSNAVDPGWVKGTGLGREGSVHMRVLAGFMSPFIADAERGADTLVWALASPEMGGRTGLYLMRRKPQRAAPHASNPAHAGRLWMLSEQLI